MNHNNLKIMMYDNIYFIIIDLKTKFNFILSCK